jgi:8-oxo-dGTP pyrophosphatase MutT (NUDIX family)
MTSPSLWAAIAAARDHDPATRLPFLIDGALVGSVAHEHLGALAAHPQALALQPGAVHLVAPEAERDAALARINAALRDAGLVVAWRDELYAVVERQGAPAFARIERAASRFWGTLTFGAHCNGYVADAGGRPTHLWIARRSLAKPTDPGLLDNLVGGGVPAHQTPLETLVREGWEEAGLTPAQMQAAQPGRVIHLRRNIPEGLQQEWLYVFDLALPAGLQPVNQDGEVAELRLTPVAEALGHAAEGEMTVDAALATLDFALRHHLLPPAEHAELAARFEPLLADTAATAFQRI